MKNLLIVNTFYEIIIAVIMIIFPILLLPQTNDITLLASRSFGVASGIMGVLSYALFRSKDRSFLVSGIVILSLFHVSMAISQIINIISYSSPFPVAVFHGIFAVLFIIQGIKHAD